MAAVTCALLLSPVLVRPIGAAPADGADSDRTVEIVETGADGGAATTSQPPADARSTPPSPGVADASADGPELDPGYLLRSDELPSLEPPEPMIGDFGDLEPSLTAPIPESRDVGPSMSSPVPTTPPTTSAALTTAPTTTTPPPATEPPATEPPATQPPATEPPVAHVTEPTTTEAPAALPPPSAVVSEPAEAVEEEEAAAALEAQAADLAAADATVSDAPGDYVGVFEVTCYTLSGNTASGAPVSTGGVAVDPSVLPLGTEVYIDGLGWHTAADTGGGVGGNHIDIWRPTDDECVSWGRRTLDVWRKAA